jgi:predicted amidophosphoribosyltransferase
MGWFIFIFILVWLVVMIILQFKTKSGKIYGSWSGQRICAFCNKRLKFAGGVAGSYASVCARCGREQPRSDSLSTQRPAQNSNPQKSVDYSNTPNLDRYLAKKTPEAREMPRSDGLKICANCGQPLDVRGAVLHAHTRVRSCHDHAKMIGLPPPGQQA